MNSTLFALNCGAYFSVASANKWGDILLTLAATNVVDIVGYYQPLREALETLGLNEFTFAQDTPKVKVLVGQVLLSRFGGGWQSSEWEGHLAYEHMAVDIENSNPSIVVAACPSGAGSLNTLKERKANNAGLILVLAMTEKVKRIMAATQPRIMVAGRPSFCCLWRENNPTIVCTRCQIVGHRPGECRAKPVCAFCHKVHLTTKHLCPVMSC